AGCRRPRRADPPTTTHSSQGRAHPDTAPGSRVPAQDPGSPSRRPRRCGMLRSPPAPRAGRCVRPEHAPTQTAAAAQLSHLLVRTPRDPAQDIMRAARRVRPRVSERPTPAFLTELLAETLV